MVYKNLVNCGPFYKLEMSLIIENKIYIYDIFYTR